MSEASSPAPIEVEPPPPPRDSSLELGHGLLGFYDRLRDKMVDAADRRMHHLGRPVAEALLLVPDVFILLARLTLDKDVPTGARTMIGGALAYFLLPVDLFPEAIVGAAGFLDDLVLGSAVLSQTLGGELEPYAAKYWSGKQDLRVVLHDIADGASRLLGGDLYRRVARVLARRGIRFGRRDDAS